MFQDERGCNAHSNEQVTGPPGSSGEPVTTELLCSHSLLRAGLMHLLADTRYAVADEDRSGNSSPSARAGEAAALYIVDASGSSQQTLGFVQDAKRKQPTARFVAVAHSFDLDLIQLAIAAGVDSFCLSTGGREVLVTILELTMAGGQFLPGTVLQPLLSEAHPRSGAEQVSSGTCRNAPDPRAKKLSPREAAILQSLMGGDANKVIARKLNVAEATVKVHIKAILRKIGAANRTQAAMWANENLRLAEQPRPSS